MNSIKLIETEKELWDETGASIETLVKEGFYRFIWSVCFKSRNFIDSLAKMCDSHVKYDGYHYYIIRKQ